MECCAGRSEPFSAMLAKRGLVLKRGLTQILQVNTGFLCNQTCGHCHVEAGPDRREVMGPEVMDEVIAYAKRGRFELVDITGGAPELNPHIEKLLVGLSGVVPRIILRSNLTALNSPSGRRLAGLLKSLRIAVTASFPSTDAAEVVEQRGPGVLESSITSLRRLNELGYGNPGSGLDLDLVHNPARPVLPVPQARLETLLRSELQAGWGVTFNNLFSFANAPLGRFKKKLERSGGLDEYMAVLAGAFNPAALDGVMCRSLVTVSWDGRLFDCDFNLAAGVAMGGAPVSIAEMDGPPLPGSPIVVSDHCYACTAGAGFT
ncbi:MAG: arsenosugar biosynthesis radical SAM (seleno)protein ArsS [Syntrophobacteraceae bacterium]